MQAYTKTIICLAKSRRPGGVCVAGREIREGQIGPWIRPVSDNGAVPSSILRMGGRWLQLCDVVEIGLKQPSPHTYQIENHLLDQERPWKRIRRATDDEVRAAIQEPATPLWNGVFSTKGGRRDKVPLVLANKSGGSLRFIAVENLSISSVSDVHDASRRKTRGMFTYAGVSYCLSITDYDVENEYKSRPAGVYAVGRSYLCVSLGEGYGGYAYKLIASVIAPQN
ncbi:MAG: hypothetical protein VX755_01870 [Pseudomonadota bacterium]|nr:hypothetical protein [Pseudomonadota bacterium]